MPNFQLILLSVLLPFCLCGERSSAGESAGNRFTSDGSNFVANSGNIGNSRDLPLDLDLSDFLDGNIFEATGSDFIANIGDIGNMGVDSLGDLFEATNSRFLANSGDIGNLASNGRATGNTFEATGSVFAGNSGHIGNIGGNSGREDSDELHPTPGQNKPKPPPTPAAPTHPPKPPCLDKKPVDTCVAWKLEGYCNKQHMYYEYMNTNCEKSCGFCGKVDIPKPQKPDYPTEDKCARVMCDMPRCSSDEVLSQDDHECCPGCVKRPSRGCTPVYKTAHKTGMPYKGWKCDTLSPIVTSSCFGVCASAAVLLESGEQFSKCDCCHPSDKRKATTVLQCATHRGTEQFLYEYSVILSCDCQANTCAPKPAASEHGGFTMTEEHMPEYNKMFHNIDEFNDKHKSY